jgi:predicted dehydrogenase
LKRVWGRVGILGGESLRVGVVGLGKMGFLHAGILNVLPDVEVAALCDKSFLIRKFVKKVLDGVRIVDDVEKLSGLDLDAVFVTTPIPSHFAVTRTIYVSKVARNLFVEKTLASSYGEAKELCELARRFGGVNMVGYTRRFAVTFRKAKDLLEQDAVGPVASFKAHAYLSDFFESKKGSRAPAARGGVLRDLGCYAIDLASWFFGDLRVASAELTSVVADSSEDYARFTVRKSGGLEGEFDVSWCMKNCRLPDVEFSINGAKGVLEVNDDKVELKLKNGKSLAWFRHDLRDNVGFWLGGPEYYREDKHFVDSVMNDNEAEPSFYTASNVDRVIDEVKSGADENE